MPDNPRWKRRPTPEKVKRGIAEVKEGRTFCLSLPLDYPGGTVVNPRRHPPRLIANKREGMPYIAYPLARENPQFVDVICDDVVEMTLQYSTQWDSLAHVGALALGIENLAAHPVQGRGVMIDLEAHCGGGESFVGYDQLMRIMEADKVEVEEGDLLCFRTGYDRAILGMNKQPDAATLAANPGAGLDGRDERLLNWITKSGVVALISDNRAVEQMPSRPCEGEDVCASLPLHAHCLFKLGVYLGEIWYLSELADWLRAHGRSRFLLTAPPLRLPGAVGSPANAVATV
jgi:kynurenine formamidase